MEFYSVDAPESHIVQLFVKIRARAVQDILIATSASVADHALLEAAYQFDRVMRSIDPEVAQRIRDKKVLCVLIGHDELTSDLPQFGSDKTGKELDFYNWHQRGFLTHRFKRPTVVFAEEDGYDKPLPGGPVDCGFDSFFGIRASTDIPDYVYIRDDRAVMPPTERIGDSHSPGDEWTKIQGKFWRSNKIAPDLKLDEVLPRFADEAIGVIAGHDQESPLILATRSTAQSDTSLRPT